MREGAADGGPLFSALIRASVLSEGRRPLLGCCWRVYLRLLAEAGGLLCLERQLCMLGETGESLRHHLLTALTSELVLGMPCEHRALAVVPLEGRLVLLRVELGLALDVGGSDVALVLDFVPRLLCLQVW